MIDFRYFPKILFLVSALAISALLLSAQDIPSFGLTPSVSVEAVPIVTDTTPVETISPTEFLIENVTPEVTDVPSVVPVEIATEPTTQPTLELTSLLDPGDVLSETPSNTPAATEEVTTPSPVEPTAIALPEAYRANFDMGFPNELGGGDSWLSIMLEVGQAVQYSDGAQTALYDAATYTDTIVEARVLLNNGDVTLYTRKSVAGHYSATLSADGTLKLYKNGEHVNTGLVSLIPGAWITLKLSTIVGILSAYVDGALVVTATDFAPLSSGQAGFGASMGTLVRLDDFAIYGTADRSSEIIVIITLEPTPEVNITVDPTLEAPVVIEVPTIEATLDTLVTQVPTLEATLEAVATAASTLEAMLPEGIPLDPPSNLQFVSSTAGSITLNWTDSGDYELDFRVER